MDSSLEVNLTEKKFGDQLDSSSTMGSTSTISSIPSTSGLNEKTGLEDQGKSNCISVQNKRSAWLAGLV